MRRRKKGLFDYYHELGVPEDADLSAIKAAYRILAVKYHPDKNPGNPVAEKRFLRIAEAYQVLSKPEARTAYDNHDHPAVRVKVKPGDTHTDGSAKAAPEPSPFVDFVKRRADVEDVIFQNNPFTSYQK